MNDIPRRAERQASGVLVGAETSTATTLLLDRAREREREEAQDVTVVTARRIWEVLLKIRDEEQGEHDTSWEVVISEKKHGGRPLRTGSADKNSPLAI